MFSYQSIRRGPADFPCCRLHVRLSLLDVVGVQQDLRVAIEGGRDGVGLLGSVEVIVRVSLLMMTSPSR